MTEVFVEMPLALPGSAKDLLTLKLGHGSVPCRPLLIIVLIGFHWNHNFFLDSIIKNSLTMITFMI